MEIYLYQEINQGDAARFVASIRGAQDLTVRINSNGGSVGEGIAIYNALRAHPHPVTIIVDGFALSIASLIAMAGRPVLMADTGMLMIHDPWIEMSGTAAELAGQADALNRVAEVMVTAYRRSSLSDEEIRELMRAETWFNADQALAAGLVDEIVEPIAMAARSTFDLSRFRNVPREVHTMTNPASRPANPASNPASNPAAQNTPAGDSYSQAMAEASFRAAEQVRRNDIRMRFTAFRTRPEYVAIERECLDDMTVTPQAASDRLLAKLGEGCEPLGGGLPPVHVGSHVVAGHDGMNDFLAAASDALLQRSGVKLERPHAGARDLARMSIVSMAESIVSRAGLRLTDRTPGGILKAAHTTSDFPLLLANTAQKALQRGYDGEPASHRMWVRSIEVMDFKEQSRIARSEAPELLLVNEGGEFTNGTFGERREAYRLATFGRIFSATRQMMVNDDLRAFTDLPAAFGASAARLEADKVYAILTGNPLMSDSVALFDNAHGNQASAGAVLSVPSLGAARAAMRKQRGLSNLGYLNIVPAYLIVPAALETHAESLLNSLTRPDAMASGVDNPQWIRSLTLVVDARLDESSETAWYLAGNSMQVDTVEIAYLQGQRGMFTEEDRDFDTDAFRLKARLDFQAAAIDWRGLYKNAGDEPEA